MGELQTINPLRDKKKDKGERIKEGGGKASETLLR